MISTDDSTFLEEKSKSEGLEFSKENDKKEESEFLKDGPSTESFEEDKSEPCSRSLDTKLSEGSEYLLSTKEDSPNLPEKDQRNAESFSANDQEVSKTNEIIENTSKDSDSSSSCENRLTDNNIEGFQTIEDEENTLEVSNSSCEKRSKAADEDFKQSKVEESLSKENDKKEESDFLKDGPSTESFEEDKSEPCSRSLDTKLSEGAESLVSTKEDSPNLPEKDQRNAESFSNADDQEVSKTNEIIENTSKDSSCENRLTDNNIEGFQTIEAEENTLEVLNSSCEKRSKAADEDFKQSKVEESLSKENDKKEESDFLKDGPSTESFEEDKSEPCSRSLDTKLSEGTESLLSTNEDSPNLPEKDQRNAESFSHAVDEEVSKTNEIIENTSKDSSCENRLTDNNIEGFQTIEAEENTLKISNSSCEKRMKMADKGFKQSEVEESLSKGAKIISESSKNVETENTIGVNSILVIENKISDNNEGNFGFFFGFSKDRNNNEDNSNQAEIGKSTSAVDSSKEKNKIEDNCNDNSNRCPPDEGNNLTDSSSEDVYLIGHYPKEIETIIISDDNLPSRDENIIQSINNEANMKTISNVVLFSSNEISSNKKENSWNKNATRTNEEVKIDMNKINAARTNEEVEIIKNKISRERKILTTVQKQYKKLKCFLEPESDKISSGLPKNKKVNKLIDKNVSMTLLKLKNDLEIQEKQLETEELYIKFEESLLKTPVVKLKQKSQVHRNSDLPSAPGLKPFSKFVNALSGLPGNNKELNRLIHKSASMTLLNLKRNVELQEKQVESEKIYIKFKENLLKPPVEKSQLESQDGGNLNLPSTSGLKIQSSNFANAASSGRKRENDFSDNSSSEIVQATKKFRNHEMDSPFRNNESRSQIDIRYRQESQENWEYRDAPVDQDDDLNDEEYFLSYERDEVFKNPRLYEKKVSFDKSRLGIQNILRVDEGESLSRNQGIQRNSWNPGNQSTFPSKPRFENKISKTKNSPLESSNAAREKNRFLIQRNQTYKEESLSRRHENFSGKRRCPHEDNPSTLPSTSRNTSVECYIQPVKFSSDCKSLKDKKREELLTKNRDDIHAFKKSRLSDQALFSLDDDLLKAIVPNNFRKYGITRFQMRKVTAAISREIDKIKEGPIPRFYDSYIRNGGIITECADEWSRDWLMDMVPRLNPWYSANLSVVDLSCLEKFYQAILWVPGSIQTPEIILKRVHQLNPTVNTKAWRVYSTEKKSAPEGFNLFMGIPNSSVNALKKLDFKPFIGMFRGSVTVSRHEDR